MRAAVLAATLLLLICPVQAQQAPPQPGAQNAPVTGAPGETTLPQSQDRAQVSPVGTGAIRGRVVRSDTGEPLRRVQVRAATEEPHSVLTDDNGRYEIARLPPGSYLLTATKGGYVDALHGQRRPFGSGRPVTLADGQVLEKIDFAMSFGGVITGRIVDETGDPVIGATVNASRMAYQNGRRQRSQVGGGQTDDRGEFRMFGLAPGDYYVQANFQLPSELSGVRTGYVPTYYPGTPVQGEAQRITIKAGEELASITFALARTRTASLSGVVRNADGSPNAMALVMVRDSAGDDVAMGSTALAVTRPDGSFVLSNVPPGSYLVQARTVGSSNAESGSTDVAVNGRDISGLALEIRKGVTARGRIRFDTNPPPKDVSPEQVRVIPVSTDPRTLGDVSVPGPPRDDWTFEITALTGRRLLRAGVFRGDWTLKSVHVDGMDVTDAPIDFRGGDVDGIEVVLTQRQTDLSGLVTDGRGSKVSDATVVVFADDPDKWTPTTRFVQRSRPDQDGRFRVRGLPPSNYVVIAVDDLEPGEETDPELLERLRPRGTRVTLADGETRTLDLKVSAY